jgi:hypothetical protein
MVGLAVSQNAANVLGDLGMRSMNVHRWLLTQRRLAAGTPTGDDEAHRLTPNDLVLVDEASMVDTAAADEIRRHVEAAGARWVQAGDHRQLGAVGAGGMMADLAGRARTFELAEVHRMTEAWERAASLRLRDGDVTVLAEYERPRPAPSGRDAGARRRQRRARVAGRHRRGSRLGARGRHQRDRGPDRIAVPRRAGGARPRRQRRRAPGSTRAASPASATSSSRA